jgi:hypothetical protein
MHLPLSSAAPGRADALSRRPDYRPEKDEMPPTDDVELNFAPLSEKPIFYEVTNPNNITTRYLKILTVG